jgi:hypothetical protein
MDRRCGILIDEALLIAIPCLQHTVKNAAAQHGMTGVRAANASEE